TTATVIKDASTNGAPTGVLGESVYDTSTVTGSPFTPTATEDYEVFKTIDGTGTHTDQAVTLSGGTAPNSSAPGQLQAGSYSYVAFYSCYSNFNDSTGPLSPPTRRSSDLTTATVIKDASTNGAPTGVLGESVYDTSTVSGSPFTP